MKELKNLLGSSYPKIENWKGFLQTKKSSYVFKFPGKIENKWKMIEKIF